MWRHVREHGMHPDEDARGECLCDLIYVARRGAEYGFSIGDMRVDMKRVKARKDAASARSSNGVEEWLRGTANCTVIQGHARFQSSNTVVVQR